MAVETQEIVVEDLEVYLAPLSTAFPALTAEPTGEWKKAGKKGILSHSESGCTLTISKTVQHFTSAGSAAPLKSWVTDRSFEAAFELADLSLETIALLCDNVSVEGATVKKVQLPSGFTNHEYAAILRGTSPQTEGKKMQWNIPSCYNGANMAPKFAPKGGPSMLSVQLIATKATGTWVSVEAE